MNKTQNSGKHPGSARLKRILWMLCGILIISGLLSLILSGFDPKPLLSVIILALFLLAFVDLVILYFLSDKYYNWTVITLLLFLTGFLFKRNHWPLGGTLISGALFFLTITSLINSVRFLLKSGQNNFLRWFGAISSFIVSIYSFGWVNVLQHWSRKLGETLGYIGIFLFLFTILGMVFTLPDSNYISWTERERKGFFRAIIFPMLMVFSLILISNVFSDLYFWILDIGGTRWDINSGIVLKNLEGIPKY